MTVIATAAAAASTSPCTSAHTCTGDGSAMRDARLRLQDMNSIRIAHATASASRFVTGAGVAEVQDW